MALMLDLDLVEQRIRAGDRMDVIAADLGVSARTVRNHLHRAGRPLVVELRRRQRRDRLDDADWLRHSYVVEGRAACAIADELRTTADRVTAALLGFDIVRPPRRAGLTRDALLAAFQAGETVSSIARQERIDRSGVRRATRRTGVLNPLPVARPRPVELDDPAWLRERYERSGETLTAMAKECGSSISTVRRSLQRHGVALREEAGHAPGRLDEGWLRERYLAGTRIAAEADVSVTTVARAIKWHGLPQRPRTLVYRLSRNWEWPGGLDPDWLRVEYQRRHRTIGEIAQDFDVSASTVRVALKRHGIRRSNRRRGTAALADGDWLRLRYVHDRATGPDIAAELGVPPGSVRNALRRHGIVRATQ